MSEESKKTAELMRHLLSSVDFSDIEKVMKDFEINPDISRDAEGFYDKHFKDVLKVYIQEQLLVMAKAGTNVDYARGTINGLFLVKEWFERHKAISLSRFDKEKYKDEPETGEIKSV